MNEIKTALAAVGETTQNLLTTDPVGVLAVFAVVVGLSYLVRATLILRRIDERLRRDLAAARETLRLEAESTDHQLESILILLERASRSLEERDDRVMQVDSVVARDLVIRSDGRSGEGRQLATRKRSTVQNRGQTWPEGSSVPAPAPRAEEREYGGRSPFPREGSQSSRTRSMRSGLAPLAR